MDRSVFSICYVDNRKEQKRFTKMTWYLTLQIISVYNLKITEDKTKPFIITHEQLRCKHPVINDKVIE